VTTLSILFEPINRRGDVFVNGTKIGEVVGDFCVVRDAPTRPGDIVRIRVEAANFKLIEQPKKPTPGRRAGGFARAASMPPERRSEIARNAARKRWGNR
jgi:hypothetical protein